MNKNLSALALTVSFVFLGGCSSTPTNYAQVDLAEIQKADAERQQKQAEMEQERLKSQLATVPDWAMSPPRPDSTGIYAVGMSDSKKLQTVIRKARMEAEFELAKQYKQEISGSERAYEQDNGSDEITEQYTVLIDKLVAAVPLQGISVVKQEVVVQDGRYNGYVMLKLPYDEFNAVLQQQKREATDSKISTAFDDLEKRLQNRREQTIADEQRNYEQQQNSVDQAHRHQMESAAAKAQLKDQALELELQSKPAVETQQSVQPAPVTPGNNIKMPKLSLSI